MLIPLKMLVHEISNSTENEKQNWIAIELHGTLKSYSEKIKNCTIGDIYYMKNNDVVLLIDRYILEGKEVQLEKPLAVIEKECEKLTTQNEKFYTVTAIIKNKLIFRTRPKPIVKIH